MNYHPDAQSINESDSDSVMSDPVPKGGQEPTSIVVVNSIVRRQ